MLFLKFMSYRLLSGEGNFKLIICLNYKMTDQTTSEVDVSAASQELGYTTMAVLSSSVDSMPIPIPRTSSTGGE